MHLVSDGGTRPYRVHFRDPSFTNLQAAAGDVRGRHGRRRHRGGRLDRPGHGRGGPVSRRPDATGFDARPARLEADAEEIIAPLPAARARRCCRCCTWCSPRRATSARDGIEFCAELLDLTTAEVAAVATFYTMYKRRPDGEYHGRRLHQHAVRGHGRRRRSSPTLKDHLGVGHDETTDDGTVTLEHIECNAACDYAPVDDGQLGVLRQPDARVGHARWSTTCAPATGRPRPAAPSAVHVQAGLAGAGRLLRRPGGRGPGCGGPATLAGLRDLPRAAGGGAPSGRRTRPRSPRRPRRTATQ